MGEMMINHGGCGYTYILCNTPSRDSYVQPMPFGDWSIFEMPDLQKNACDSVQHFTDQNRDMGFNTAQQVLAWVNHKELQFRLASLITLVCSFGRQKYGEDEPAVDVGWVRGINHLAPQDVDKCCILHISVISLKTALGTTKHGVCSCVF